MAVRLNRFLAAAGIASRRQADELIAQGRVTVNGRRCNDFHYQPGPGDHVKVDDKLISHKTQVYLALNKPRGFVCTQRDLHATDTIFDLLPPKFSRLFHVGRLDAQSEGLLLLTNDGDFVQRLTHPRFKIEKEYEVKLDNCSAVITGASAGVGREFARQLATRAQRIVLIARRRDRLEELRLELQARNPALQVESQVADLSVLEYVMELGRTLSKDKPVDFLINNAGLGDYGPVSTADPRRLNEMIQVNVLAVTALTRALLPQMIAQKRGAILNVSSSAGFLPIPGFAVYAATKAYVTSFSEALRAEVRETGISVCALCPGPVHTEFMSVDVQGQPLSANATEFVPVPVEKVVRAGLNGIEMDKALVIPGTIMKIGMALARLSPIALMRLGWRFSERRV